MANDFEREQTFAHFDNHYQEGRDRYSRDALTFSQLTQQIKWLLSF
jgi:hypothetical protein